MYKNPLLINLESLYNITLIKQLVSQHVNILYSKGVSTVKAVMSSAQLFSIFNPRHRLQIY